VTTDAAFNYIGDELQTFALARNWKAYLAQQVRPFLGDDVLEVGAGLGETTQAFYTSAHRRWTLLEPDPTLADAARAKLLRGDLPAACAVRVGSTHILRSDELFDSILYIDVLEHIELDAAELTRATQHLRSYGHIIVLSPAHQLLYSPFDAHIGHFRRYNRRSLTAITPSAVRLVRLRYLDAVGMFASAANRAILRQEIPTRAQVLFWDRRMVPVSRVMDALLNYRVGKSILAVWRHE
jgi:ubiquinone/menaquinone biosynthesis C-methylase UbiE